MTGSATHFLGWLKKILIIPNDDKDAEQLDLSYISHGNAKVI